jgi:hypothetical protein
MHLAIVDIFFTMEVRGQLSNAVHLEVVSTSTDMSDNLASATHNVSASAEAGKSSELLTDR